MIKSKMLMLLQNSFKSNKNIFFIKSKEFLFFIHKNKIIKN
jgi:hypothetical protein